MRREAVDDVNRCTYRVIYTEDSELPGPFRQQPAARSEGLKPDEHDRVSFIRQPLNQVMQNTASRRHSVCRNDDGWKAMLVDCLGIGNAARKMHPLGVKRIRSPVFQLDRKS